MYNIFMIPLVLAFASLASATIHSVQVGLGGNLTYDPPTVTAAVGDIVSFLFDPHNHTVTQSSFANPCHSSGGFKSGFEPTNITEGTPGEVQISFNITINSTAPIWGYCGQTGHCQAGMVFAINADPNSNQSFAAFQAAAIASGNASTNASASTTAGGNPTGGASASGTAGTGSPTGSDAANPSSTDSGADGSSGALSTSVNLGLTGVLAVVGIVLSQL